MEFQHIFVACFAIVCGVHLSSACDGQKLQVSYFDCLGNQSSVVKIGPESTISLNADCEVEMTICPNIAGFETAKMRITVSKGSMILLKTTTDICEDLRKYRIGFPSILADLGLPSKCPFKKMQKCVESVKFSLSMLKGVLSYARGTTDVKVEMIHDTGKSCLDISITLDK